MRLKSNDPCWCGSGRKFKRCHKAAGAAIGAPAPAAPSAPVRPGLVSPPRPVPASIARPDYAETGIPSPAPPGIIVHPPERIERLRRAGRVARQVLDIVGAAVRPGVTTEELDAIAHEATIERGAYPSPLNYHGYPKSLCTSVNEVICHGIPDDRALEDGDIVNLDVTVFLDGVHGDNSRTYLVGDVDEESRRLVRVTEECLDRGIAVVRPGAQVRDIGRAIEDHATANGFGVVRAFVGHGIGEWFHTAPHVPHYYEPAARTQLVPGMTFTIEPMITAGEWRHDMWDDGWTAVTVDGLRTAQFEHTVLVTDDGVEILTLPE